VNQYLKVSPLPPQEQLTAGSFRDKIMKKLITLLLVIITTGLLTACGGGASSSSSDNRDSTSSLVGSASLSWTAPSTRADNSYLPMTELQGYRIYYGTSANDLSMLVDLNDSTITNYSLNDLPAGTYFFSVTAYDLDGLESGLSNVISKDV
jgi:hypothetical protein